VLVRVWRYDSALLIGGGVVFWFSRFVWIVDDACVLASVIILGVIKLFMLLVFGI